jgi:uncharacterized protein
VRLSLTGMSGPSDKQADAACSLSEFLRKPEHYPEPTRCVEVIETHFAWVFLTDCHAYKLKKPLQQDCLDYRTLAARWRGCRDELRLNRRLAPTVYLGLIPITRMPDGALVLGRRRSGTVVDWVVKMRRLPAARMLDRAVVEHRVRAVELTALSACLARFFESATRRPMSASRYIARLRALAETNRLELCASELRLDARRVKAVCAAQLAFISAHAVELGERGALLVDGHGDLRPEHLYLGSAEDAPCAIDCLEFNNDLRRLDPAEELAFLALECRRISASRVGRILLSRFRAASRKPPSQALLYFYMSQRSMTRAKLTAWHLRDPQFVRRAAVWRALAHSYVADAAEYVRRAEHETQRADCSTIELDGPAIQQGNKRLSGDHAPHGLAE